MSAGEETTCYQRAKFVTRGGLSDAEKSKSGPCGQAGRKLVQVEGSALANAQKKGRWQEFPGTGGRGA